MLKKLITFAFSSGLAAMAWKLWIEREQRQRAARAREQSREIQRWEDEGGNPAPAAPSTAD